MMTWASPVSMELFFGGDTRLLVWKSGILAAIHRRVVLPKFRGHVLSGYHDWTGVRCVEYLG